MAAEVSLRVFILSIFLASAAAAQNRVAVLPVQPRSGVLTPADAAAVSEQMRTTARDSLADRGYEVLTAEGSDPSDALESTGASLVVFGRAAEREGATVVGIGLYKPGAAVPVSVIRVMGIGIAQLRADVRAKLPGPLASALGLAPPSVEAKLPPGTLRIPGGTRQPAPEPQAIASPPPPAPALPPLVSPTPPADEDPLVTIIRETTTAVEQLRGLRRKQNLKVQILDDKLFSAAVREKAKKELTPAVVAAERARWLAFNLAPARRAGAAAGERQIAPAPARASRPARGAGRSLCGWIRAGGRSVSARRVPAGRPDVQEPAFIRPPDPPPGGVLRGRAVRRGPGARPSRRNARDRNRAHGRVGDAARAGSVRGEGGGEGDRASLGGRRVHGRRRAQGRPLAPLDDRLERRSGRERLQRDEARPALLAGPGGQRAKPTRMVDRGAVEDRQLDRARRRGPREHRSGRSGLAAARSPSGKAVRDAP